jgi:hypothetical protein
MQETDHLAARRFRVIAGWTVGIVSTSIAATAHMIAGGGTPSVAALTLALFVSGGVGMLIVGTRLTRGRTGVGVILDQFVFHTLFTFFGTSNAGAAKPQNALSAFEPHGGNHGIFVLITPDATMNSSSAAMIASHIGAALVAYAMLRRGVAAIRSISAALAIAVSRAFKPVPVAIGLPGSRSTCAVRRLPIAVCNSRDVLPPRRGPPIFTTV